MSRLIASKKSNPCPVCENSSGKCRQSASDSDYWQCMTYSDSRIGESVNGYTCLGVTKDGMWGQFKRGDNSRDWKEEQREEWLSRKREREERAGRERREKAGRSLSNQDRDRQYRQLLSELDLHPSDRADLIRRGFSEREIELSGFKSVRKWHQLEKEYSVRLPGVSLTGDYLNVGEGYLCPVKNHEGLILALQIRLRKLENGDKGRYRWLTSITKNNPNGQGPQIYFESIPELPLAIHKPQGKIERISLAEGVGVKPFLACQRLNQLVIGAAGGLFSSSPNSLKSALSLYPEIREVSLLADAESVANFNVTRQYVNTYQLLKSWGITLTVAWWNQIKKSDCDIDELPTERYPEIKYISFDEFRAIALKHGGIKSQPSEEKKDDWKSYIKPIEELPKIGFHIKRKTQEQLLEDFPALNTPRGREWKKLREFTPDITINSQYFDYDPKPGENLAVKSGLGTGKSYFVNAKWLKDPADGAVIGGYRNVLLEQFCANGKKLNGRNWYQIQGDLKGTQDMILISDPQSRIAASVDSWIYFSPHNFDGKKVIFDEIESVAKHLNQSKTAVSYNREIIRQRVADAISLGDSTFIADGNLRDFTVDYIEKVSGKKFTRIKNTYTGNRGKIYLYDGSSRKKQATEECVGLGLAENVGDWISCDIKQDDYSKIHQIMVDLPTDIPLLITSDSQKKCEAFDVELAKLGRKVFRLDSTTSGSDEGRAFLADPKDFILLHKIDTVVLSPSAESGVSIELSGDINNKLPGYFKYEFAYFFGVSTTDTQVQFVGRNRDPYTNKFVYVQTQNFKNQDITNDQVSNDIGLMWLEKLKECASLSLEGIEDDKILEIAFEFTKSILSDPHYQYESKLALKESFERAYPRRCLEYALRDSGWEVLLIEGREDDLSDLREIEEEIEVKRAIAIFEAQEITPSEAEKLSRKLNKTTDERNQIAKNRLLTRLPGIEEKSITTKGKFTAQEIMDLSMNEQNKILSVNGEDYQSWLEKQSGEDRSDKNLEVAIERPAFNPAFIKMVTFDKRDYLSKMTAQFLLRNPEICEKIQQNKWHKRLEILTDPEELDHKKKLRAANYKSQWVQVKTLWDMGIEFFLNPESTWHSESPEAIAFLEKGKLPGNAGRIGVKPGDNPCEFIGRILKSFNIKTRKKKLKCADGSRQGEYRLATPNPLDLAVYECLVARFEIDLTKIDLTKIDLNWSKILKNSPLSAAETLTEQEIQRGHLTPDFSIDNQGEGVPNFEPSKILKNSPLSAAETLTEQEIQRGHLTPDFSIDNQGEGVPNFDDHPPLDSYAEGQEVWAYLPRLDPSSNNGTRWAKCLVEWSRGNLIKVSKIGGWAGAMIERSHLIAPGEWELA